MRFRFALLSLAASVASAAPLRAQAILAVDGRDEFQWIEYVGGDATQPKGRFGWLVLSDSTLSFHRCTRQYCEAKDGKGAYDSLPYFTIALRTITDVSSSTSVRGASTGSKIAFGLLAGDRKEEHVGLVYETATSAEAPIFKTKKAQAAALEAKIRFRLKKLGVTLPTPAP